MSKTRVEFIVDKCRVHNELLRKLLVEFMATTMLMYFGLTAEAQQILNGWQSTTHLPNAIGWGLGLLFAVLIGYRVSGAHLNPAVSFVLWTFGQMPFAHFLLYSLVQTGAAYFAAMLTYLLYFDKIAAFDGGVRAVVGPTATAAIFATYPGPHLSPLGAIIEQISSSAVLLFFVFAIIDSRNKIPKAAQPVLFGLLLTVLCCGFALNSGNAMNPARDLGPRIFSLVVGYGWEVFSLNNYTWFWVPVLCPFIGGLIGAWAYQLLISAQIEDDEEGTTLKGAEEDGRLKTHLEGIEPKI